MASTKEKITLTEEQETLLITLYSKVVEGRRPNPIFVDEKAQEILDRVEYDFSRLKTPRKTTVMVCMRAMKLDTYAREFLASHPRSMVIHLGCGLDGRCARVPHESAEWYDLDMPEVIDLRRKFYDETDTYHMIASSVTNWGWIDRISAQGRSVLVIAEGLLMYLKEEDVKTLILKLKAAFPGCEIAFDAFSTMTARSVKAHRSLKATGAAAHWGIDDAKAIEQWADGIKLKEEWYFTQSEVVDKLGTLYSLSFKIAGLFPVVNRAHRILYYCL